MDENLSYWCSTNQDVELKDMVQHINPAPLGEGDHPLFVMELSVTAKINLSPQNRSNFLKNNT